MSISENQPITDEPARATLWSLWSFIFGIVYKFYAPPYAYGGPFTIKLKRKLLQRLAIFLLATVIFTSCASVSSTSLPPRPFPTTDLLIQRSLLPVSWKLIEELDQELSCHSFDYDYYHCAEVQTRNIRYVGMGFDQILARFDNVTTAARTYRRHDFTRNTKGAYGRPIASMDLRTRAPLPISSRYCAILLMTKVFRTK